MNLLQLRQRCRSRFRDIAQQFYDDSEWTAYLNEAVTDTITATAWWPFLDRQASVTVQAGADRFTIGVQVPSTATIKGIFNVTDDVQVTPVMAQRDQWKMYPDNTERGVPTNYRLVGQDVILIPTPAAATTLSFEYVAAVTADLAADADIPPIPERFHRMLIYGALARAYTDDGNAEQAQMHQARFDKAIQAMMMEELSGREDEYAGLVDTFWR